MQDIITALRSNELFDQLGPKKDEVIGLLGVATNKSQGEIESVTSGLRAIDVIANALDSRTGRICQGLGTIFNFIALRIPDMPLQVREAAAVVEVERCPRHELWKRIRRYDGLPMAQKAGQRRRVMTSMDRLLKPSEADQTDDRPTIMPMLEKAMGGRATEEEKKRLVRLFEEKGGLTILLMVAGADKLFPMDIRRDAFFAFVRIKDEREQYNWDFEVTSEGPYADIPGAKRASELRIKLCGLRVRIRIALKKEEMAEACKLIVEASGILAEIYPRPNRIEHKTAFAPVTRPKIPFDSAPVNEAIEAAKRGDVRKLDVLPRGTPDEKLVRDAARRLVSSNTITDGGLLLLKERPKPPKARPVQVPLDGFVQRLNRHRSRMR